MISPFLGETIPRMFLNHNHDTNFYSRMICSLYCKNSDTSQVLKIDKIYTIDELLCLIENNGYILIDNFVESENISKDEIDECLCIGNIVLSDARLNSLNFDNKILADFTTCKNDYDRKVWYILYGGLFHYIRINYITFDNSNNDPLVINLSDDYNKIIEHLLNVFDNIKSRYRKKGKELPNNIKNVIADALCKIENEKDDNFKNKNLINITYKKV